MQRFLLCALMLLLTWLPTQAQADAQLSGTTCMSSEGEIVGNIPLQGGRFVCQGVLKITQAGQYVIDFKNTSTLAQFQHEISDGHHTMHVLSGGLSSEHTDQLLLRHGRLVALQPGTYRLITWLQSPYYLAQPEVFVTDLASHQQQTNVSTAVSLLLLGILLGIFSYYMAIGIMPGHVTERMYALFILGNLIFQSAVLGLFKQLFDWHWFYLTSLPILFSNLAYISFVCHLLGISPFRHSRLYQVSIAARLTLLGLMVFAMIYPNWMLEMDRLGVAIFLVFGLVCGIRLSLQGQRVAQLYLLAISIFGVLGGLTITADRLSSNAWTVEQLGLIAVTVEAVALSLLVAYQINRLHKEKEHMLAELESTRSLAMTDRLTGVPNRHALENQMLHFPEHGCLMFLDIDNLKHVNDQYGHEAGDQLLKSFSRILTNKLDTHGKLYRLGGDEFAIVCHEDDVEWCQHQLEYTHLHLQKEGIVGAGTSVGIVFAHEATDTESLMRIADKRMYADKRARKNRKEMVQVFTH
ncbi:GGDEF domain-containing protein [Methylophilus glucosoxydans]|uniref:diguanylate cyclase n=1 Tax=Methylophilus glucosoxydans TaxID=752553 RepID=A0ABW3GH86_9PROT|nr:GGDEF domain-containing protein [Methylophilus sp. DW102]